MKNLNGKVAVVTGGASGIGRAMAERFAEEGMKIVLADLETQALEKTAKDMKGEGADVLSVTCDVSKSSEIQALAEKTVSAFGGVHVVCNNAGVGIGGSMWEISEEDWAWVLGVNLWGVIHGIRTFVPIMIEGGDDGHIVNTASMAGLTSGPRMAPYHVSKHGVVTMSESLYHELILAETKIGVSVLCPGWVDTNIHDSDRNRPGGPRPEEELTQEDKDFRDAVKVFLAEGLPPKSIAEMVLQAVLNNKFYILPHGELKHVIRRRVEEIVNEKQPTMLGLEEL